jgi:hypothetical protein
MNANKLSRLTGTFLHIDRLIADSLGILESLDDPTRITRYRRDASPNELRVIEGRLRALCDLMSTLLYKRGIPAPEPVCGVRSAVHSYLILAVIALDELGTLPSWASPIMRELEDLMGSLANEDRPEGRV